MFMLAGKLQLAGDGRHLADVHEQRLTIGAILMNRY